MYNSRLTGLGGRNGPILHLRPTAALPGRRLQPPPPRLGSCCSSSSWHQRQQPADRHDESGRQEMALPAWRRYRWITLPKPPELRLTMMTQGPWHTGSMTTCIFLLYFALLFSTGIVYTLKNILNQDQLLSLVRCCQKSEHQLFYTSFSI